MIVDAVKDQMAVRIIVIMMADKEKLSVLDAHQFHVFKGNLGHHFIGQFIPVLWLEAQGNVSDGL